MGITEVDREKILENFEYAVRKSHEEGWDYVDGLTTEDGFKILQLLKEQDKIIQNILIEKANELNDKVTTLQIEAQNREIRIGSALTEKRR